MAKRIKKEKAPKPSAWHHPTCAHAIGSLDFAYDHCVCPKGWPRKPKVEKAAKTPNPCHLAPHTKIEVPTDHYALRMDFAPSVAQLIRYCEHHRYKMEMNYQTDDGIPRPTFDETAMEKLHAKYPHDRLFPLVKRYRETQKCLGTYVDGLTLWPSDLGSGFALAKAELLHIPKTGRLACKGSPHQLQPRTSDPLNPYYKVREMYVASPGCRLAEIDFSGLEAVLTFYLAGVTNAGLPKPGTEDARQGLRLTQSDIHSYLATHDIGQPADLKWSDADLNAYFAEFRKENRKWVAKSGKLQFFEDIRDCDKMGLYGSLYAGGPGTLVRSRPDVFSSIAIASAVQGLIFDLFPSVPKWWWEVAQEAEQYGYITTQDGYPQHFSDVLDHVYLKKEARWDTRLNRTANEAIAAKPQHLGMCFTAQGIDLFWEQYPQYRDFLRLTIHDSVLGEHHEDTVMDVCRALKGCMETPLPFLPLPVEWGMGTHLKVKVDTKMSTTAGDWRQMEKVKV